MYKLNTVRNLHGNKLTDFYAFRPLLNLNNINDM